MPLKNNRPLLHAWAMYDWANSAFSLVIASAIFPAYYNTITTSQGVSTIRLFGIPVENTAAYSINLGLAFGFVALISPLLSAIADYRGLHRAFMRFFCHLGALGCMLLFFFDAPALAPLALLAMLLATVGYAGSIVFYNAYLPAIATDDRQDRVSARGFAYGYVGSTTLLLLNLALILNQAHLGITDDTLLPRVSFLLTGVWWLGFAQIPLRRLPQSLHAGRPRGHDLLHGYRELVKVWNAIRAMPRLRAFLLSFFFYGMGVQTVMFMASSFGQKVIHLGTAELIVTVLLIEYVGIAGAFLFAGLSRRLGNLRALMIAVAAWMLICAAACFIMTPLHFYAAGFFIGLVMGGIQSLSRSTYARMIPDTHHNAGFFSFFDVTEKLAMMSGLVLWGTLDHITGSMRGSIVALVAWFGLGLLLLLVARRIPHVRARQA